MALLSCLVCFVCAACDREKEARPLPTAPARAPVASIERVFGIDAGALELAVDPPAPAGDLKTELDQFATVEGCVQSHANLDPLVGDSLEAIGYDTFLRDACRVLDAAKKREPSRCDAIDASMLRARCQTTVAQVAGDADACPWEIPSRPERGREPACVAIASRQAALCLATADAVARAICEAIVTHDVAPCAKLPTRAGKARCTRDAERWRAAIPAADSSGAARAASPGASGQLHVEGPSAGVDADLAADLARGVVFVEQRDGTRFVLGPLTAGGPGFVASSPQAQGSLALELFTPALPSSERRPAGATPTGVVRRAELQVPGHAPVTAPPARSTLVAKIEELEPGRGGPLRLSVEGEMGDGTGSWRVRYRASTFVRDIVKASAIYDLGIPRLGADGGMR